MCIKHLVLSIRLLANMVAGHLVLLGGMRRLAWPTRADWPIILSVGVLQLTCFFAFANLGVQVLPAGRSGVLAYTTMLWMVL